MKFFLGAFCGVLATMFWYLTFLWLMPALIFPAIIFSLIVVVVSLCEIFELYDIY